MDKPDAVESLDQFLFDNESVVVISGAGVSTSSGIPDYRDRNGEWKHTQPMQFGEFRSSEKARQRYWARSYVGWQRFSVAKPNVAHRVLADLESSGKSELLVTQNVDGLHQQAGSRNVVELHGNLAKVRCVDCGATHDRSTFQESLKAANAEWHAEVLRHKPDGDAEVESASEASFSVSGCDVCGGIVKPDVVMFGESVPKSRVERVQSAIDRAAALLVVGSSLMVYSAFRFVRHAHAQGKPIAIINQGRTRADDLAALKVEQDVGAALSAALPLMTS